MSTPEATLAQSGDPASEALLSARGLVKRFGGFVAVNKVDIDARAGHITAMIGPNGAGKSTVINLLSGALLPTQGSVTIHGQSIVGRGSHEVARMGLARTFQTPRLFDGLTVGESMMLPRALFAKSSYLECFVHSPRTRNDERVAWGSALDWLGFVGLADVADMPMSALPVGSQRLVEVARALALEPDIVLLDEPAAGLDHTETERLAGLIEQIARADIGVLLVEHDMHLVMSVADAVVVLDAGVCIATGTASEVSEDPTVIEAYLGVVHDKSAEEAKDA